MSSIGPERARLDTRAIFLALAGAAGLFLAWRAAEALLLIFTGLLLAALLDACARVLGKVLPIGRGWNVAIVSLVIALALAGLLVWSSFSIAGQIHALLATLDAQLKALEHGVGQVVLAPSNGGADASPARRVAHFLFPDPHRMF